MALKNLNILPPGGMKYVQPETGFSAPPMVPFGNVCAAVLQHRIANSLPRATKAEVSEDVQEYNCKRLGYDPQFCITSDQFKKKASTLSNLLASPGHLKDLAKHVVKKAEAIGKGSQILLDWLGDGLLPVATELAQSRADVCLGVGNGKPCKFNQPGSRITDAIAGTIQEQMAKRHEVTAKVTGEEKLFTCALCYCNLPLKVHVPMATILERTPDSMIKKFQQEAPAHCWMKNEANPNPA